MQSGEALVRDSFVQLSAQYSKQASQIGRHGQLQGQESWVAAAGAGRKQPADGLATPFWQPNTTWTGN